MKNVAAKYELADTYTDGELTGMTVTNKKSGVVYYITARAYSVDVIAVDSRAERRVKQYEPRYREVMAVALFGVAA